MPSAHDPVEAQFQVPVTESPTELPAEQDLPTVEATMESEGPTQPISETAQEEVHISPQHPETIQEQMQAFEPVVDTFRAQR